MARGRNQGAGICLPRRRIEGGQSATKNRLRPSRTLLFHVGCSALGVGRSSSSAWAQNLCSLLLNSLLSFPRSYDCDCELDAIASLTQYQRMQPQTFERSLRAFSQRVPFQPFAVELVSGAVVTVDHPEAIVFRAGLAVYISPDGTPSLFDHEGVSQLSGAHGSSLDPER